MFCESVLCLNAFVVNFDRILTRFIKLNQGRLMMDSLDRVINWQLYFKKYSNSDDDMHKLYGDQDEDEQ